LREFSADSKINGRGASLRELKQTANAKKQYNPIVISARNPDALNSLAFAWSQFLSEGDVKDCDLPAIAYSALHRRTLFRHRVGFAASGVSDAYNSIQSFLNEEPSHGVTIAEASHRPPKIAFVFCGHGAHWHGMGRQLFDSETVFREAIERCDSVIGPIMGWSLIDELRSGERNGRLERTSIAQPILFSIQVALEALW